MKDTCINCGKWKGLHKWDTMQCPFEGDDLFLANQFYAEENAELAALRAERDELREALKTIADPKNWRNRNGETVWNDCEGNEFIPEHAQEIARAVLAKYPTDEILKREG